MKKQEKLNAVDRAMDKTITNIEIAKWAIVIATIVFIFVWVVSHVTNTQARYYANYACCDGLKCSEQIEYHQKTNTCIIKTCKPCMFTEKSCIWQGNKSKIPESIDALV